MFQVNASTTHNQEAPAITALNNGGFVVTWQSDNDWSIKAQVFDASGSKLGSEITASSSTNVQKLLPTVTALANGGFVTTWVDGSSNIAAQVFDASGQKVGNPLQVNVPSGYSSYYANPTIALGNGGFVVTWIDSDGIHGDSSGSAIMAQTFDSSGNKIGSEFLINTQTAGYQVYPVIAALSNGGFAVSWQDGDQYGLYPGSGTLGDTSGSGIKAQVFGMNTLNTITGTSGNDTLLGVGGTTLIGNGGNDTYRLAQLQNSEIIVNGTAGSTAPSGTLQFTAVAPNQLWLDHAGADLVIDVLGTSQKVTIQNWYGSPGAQLGSVQAGTFALSNNQVDTLIQAMTTFEASYAASHGGMAFDPTTAGPTIADTTVAAAVNSAWHPVA